MTCEELADVLINEPSFSLWAVTGKGGESYGSGSLADILLYGLVKVKVYWQNHSKSIVGTPEEIRRTLQLLEAKKLANVSLANLAPPAAVRVKPMGPTRLHRHADAFPLVTDLATYGRRRLLKLPQVGENTVRQAAAYCELYGLHLAD